MKLIVPHTGEVQPADNRLIRLAEFLGVRCEPVRLAKEVQQRVEYFERLVLEQNSCLVINPQVMREWVGGPVVPAELVSSLLSRFPWVFMHALTLDPFVEGMVAAVSGGKLKSVLPIADASQPYQISSVSKDICGPFSGLSFGPINAANDRVLGVSPDDLNVGKLICIGGRPHMAVVTRGKTEIFFLASEDTADIDAETGGDSIDRYFSRLIPHAMALRYIFGEECWRPCKTQASIIIDDPLLRPNYGYLNFESLLRLMEEHNFHTTISFIPHNYRRNSARIIRMFRENPHRLSICFHGNDHTKAEFASTNFAFLNSVLGIAEERMKVHAEENGLHCDRVMVFPQDNYSVEAMEVLKSRNFHAAISRPYPVQNTAGLKIADLAQPAVLRYGGIPLFTRNFIRDTQSQNIATNLFFGRPILIGEHHDAFKHPGPLLEVVQKINAIAPGIRWSSLESVADNSILKLRMSDGTVRVRPYSRSVLIQNNSTLRERYSIEWGQRGQCTPIEQVLRNGTRLPGVEINDTGIRILAELPPGASYIFVLNYVNNYIALQQPSFMSNVQAFLRRRLSEVRDNYLSKNEHVLTAARALQRRFLN
jgi:hypothetical protein